MAIFQRQNTNNIEVKELYQRQGTGNVKIDTGYQRQGTSDILIYEASSVYQYNCEVQINGSSVQIDPIDNTKDCYVFLRYRTDAEAGSASVRVTKNQNVLGDINVFFLGTLPSLSSPLSEKPHPATTDLDVTLSFYTGTLSQTENVGDWYRKNIMIQDSSLRYNNTTYINASFTNRTPYAGDDWYANIHITDGYLEIEPLNSSSFAIGYILIYNGIGQDGITGSLSADLMYLSGEV